MITVIGNLKGGSGKSTVTFNTAVWLATRGCNVTVFDLDPQRTLSDVAEVRDEENFAPSVAVKRPTKGIGKLLRSESGEVLVDVGTADMKALREALSVADRVIVPVPPSQADIWSTQRFFGLIEESSKGSPDIWVFVNRADTHHAVRESDEAAEALAMIPGIRLLSERLHQRTAYRRSFSEGLGVFELEPSGKAAGEFHELAAALYPAQVKAKAKAKVRKGETA